MPLKTQLPVKRRKEENISGENVVDEEPEERIDASEEEDIELNPSILSSVATHSNLKGKNTKQLLAILINKQSQNLKFLKDQYVSLQKDMTLMSMPVKDMDTLKEKLVAMENELASLTEASSSMNFVYLL